eukprot:gene11115-biopygen168
MITLRTQCTARAAFGAKISETGKPLVACRLDSGRLRSPRATGRSTYPHAPLVAAPTPTRPWSQLLDRHTHGSGGQRTRGIMQRVQTDHVQRKALFVEREEILHISTSFHM